MYFVSYQMARALLLSIIVTPPVRDAEESSRTTFILSSPCTSGEIYLSIYLFSLSEPLRCSWKLFFFCSFLNLISLDVLYCSVLDR